MNAIIKRQAVYLYRLRLAIQLEQGIPEGNGKQSQIPMIHQFCPYNTSQIPLILEFTEYRRGRSPMRILEINRIHQVHYNDNQVGCHKNPLGYLLIYRIFLIMQWNQHQEDIQKVRIKNG